MNPVHFSTGRPDWETPAAFFAALDREFGFTLDACANHDNYKVDSYITPEDDALKRVWATTGAVWCNPPYGPEIGKWVKRAFEQSQKQWVTVVLLLPARTETSWWHDYVMKADEIRLIRGRLQFASTEKTRSHNAPFPNAIVVFRPGERSPRLTAMDRILDDATP